MSDDDARGRLRWLFFSRGLSDEAARLAVEVLCDPACRTDLIEALGGEWEWSVACPDGEAREHHRNEEEARYDATWRDEQHDGARCDHPHEVERRIVSPWMPAFPSVTGDTQ